MEEFFGRLNAWHNKYFRYVLLAVLIAVVFLVARFLPRLIVLFLPFLIAWILSRLVGRFSRLLTKYLRFPDKLAIIVSVLLFAAVLVLLLSWLISAIVSGVVLLSQNINSLYEVVRNYLSQAGDTLNRMFEALPDDVFTVINDSLDELGSTLVKWASTLATRLAGGAFAFAKNLPEIIVFIVVLVLATYFFTKDREKLHALYLRLVKAETRDKLTAVKHELLGAAGGYVRAQLTIMLITAIELTVGFFILDVPFAVLAAVIVALLDALPVLGTGTVLVPWAIISCIIGDFFVGIGVLILYVICLCVRNLIEPRLVSRNIGLHPLATIMAMYVGLKIYGFIGMILFPITVLCIVKLYRIGMFDWLFPNRVKAVAEGEK